MAMQYIDVTGTTDAEAIEKALRQLGLERDDVSVEILERAKKGFLGFGASNAKVRVTYEVPDAPVPVQPPVEKKAEKPEKPAEKPAPKQPKQAERPRREKAEEKKEPKKEPKKEGKEVKEPKEIKEPKEPKVSVELGEEIFDEKSQQIRAFLNGLMEHMDSDAKAKVYQPEKGRYKVILEGSRMGALIGRRGETLDAIQQLTNYSMNRGSDKRVRIQVDAEGYREKREESLQRLAVKTAAKVVKYRRNVTLEPMNAYERHVIHTALQDTEGVTTFSTGTDPNRRVVVAYDRGR